MHDLSPVYKHVVEPIAKSDAVKNAKPSLIDSSKLKIEKLKISQVYQVSGLLLARTPRHVLSANSGILYE
jgi:hypothetical protein